MTCNYLIVCCVETGSDSVVMKTEADSNDITEYTHDYKPVAGMFDVSYAASSCLRYLVIVNN